MVIVNNMLEELMKHEKNGKWANQMQVLQQNMTTWSPQDVIRELPHLRLCNLYDKEKKRIEVVCTAAKFMSVEELNFVEPAQATIPRAVNILQIALCRRKDPRSSWVQPHLGNKKGALNDFWIEFKA